jgi:ribosomal protein S18 acetylase RimI-like enzyme
VLFRAYTEQDFAELYAIEELCFPPPFRFGRRQMRQLVQSGNAATWIAEQDGRMCGFAIAEWTAQAGQIAAYIQTIEVAPDWRGQGVGGELLGRIEASARAAGAKPIWLHVDAENAAAIRLYEANGYRIEGREENYYPRGRAALICSKALGALPVSQVTCEDAHTPMTAPPLSMV